MFFGLFKKKKKNVSSIADASYAVGDTGIRYHPDLIDGMKADHVNLLNIYTDIQVASEAKNFKKVAIYLNEFRIGLEDHLLKENVNLYIYLSHLLKGDAMNSELIAKFRKEMDGIASIALKFLAKYESIGDDPNLREGFADEFATIGKVLGNRIKREEETLYTLYVPPH
ncbi:hypothetical protein MNBD_GAMMA09-282 [hydrothermal vent metagenome]|uniref:Hemerythrin-like domain-containing protein n=1 Tax=hydrothermal vent metagenome TaxID=652676 RepID=A0A3B0XK56_9ZZZZ